MIVKKLGLAVVSFLFVMGLALGSFAAREVVSGTVDKVDAGKGHVWLKTQAGPREFNFRDPAKLKDLKPGDKIEVTLQEDGTGMISGPGTEQKPTAR